MSAYLQSSQNSAGLAAAPRVEHWLQPAYYDEFSCIGAACEDTCCSGMAVSISQTTYGNYQKVSDPALKPRIQQFVTIEAAPTPMQYARIRPENGSCAFLTENLCGLQLKLGEEHLSDVCATYPRILKRRGAVGSDEPHERSLDLSCPEAARLALSNPNPLQLQVVAAEPAKRRVSRISQTQPFEDEIRSAFLNILQNRRYTVSQRVSLAGHMSEKLSELFREGTTAAVPDLLEGFATAIDGGFFDVHLMTYAANPVTQLGIVLELLVGRIRLDYTAQRFLDIYQEFTKGLRLEPNSTIDDLGERYKRAYASYFQPFLEKHEHMLEHYLVTFAYNTLFPFGSASVNSALELTQAGDVIHAQYLLMATYFSILKATMTGMAAFHREAFGPSQAIRAVQACTRALEHCLTFPRFALDLLKSKRVASPGAIAVLTQNLTLPFRKAAQHSN